jgi:hypothetical protein
MFEDTKSEAAMAGPAQNGNAPAPARKTKARAKSIAAGTAPSPPVPEAVAVPLEIHEQSRKPVKAKTIITSGVSKRTGKPFFMIVAAPGYAIARVILTDLDRESKRTRVAIIAERRRGRPANSQRGKG